MAETLTQNPEDLKREEDRQEIIKRLKDLLIWNNEIPEEIITCKSPDPRYKIRRGWFAAVLTIMQWANNEKLLSPNSSDRLCQMLKLHQSKEFKARDKTAQDIEEIDEFIDEVIRELEGNQDGRV